MKTLSHTWQAWGKNVPQWLSINGLKWAPAFLDMGITSKTFLQKKEKMKWKMESMFFTAVTKC